MNLNPAAIDYPDKAKFKPLSPAFLRRSAWRLPLLIAASAAICLQIGCARIRPPQRSPDQVLEMNVTAYCNCGKCCGWKRNWRGVPIETATGRRKQIGVTASGSRTRPGTVAAPPAYPFGTIVHVEGWGYGRVEDRGGAIQGRSLDLWFPSHEQALQWGRQNKRVKIWLPRE